MGFFFRRRAEVISIYVRRSEEWGDTTPCEFSQVAQGYKRNFGKTLCVCEGDNL